ncbi:unnamed protein product [Leuciscus chuanchicus]
MQALPFCPQRLKFPGASGSTYVHQSSWCLGLLSSLEAEGTGWGGVGIVLVGSSGTVVIPPDSNTAAGGEKSCTSVFTVILPNPDPLTNTPQDAVCSRQLAVTLSSSQRYSEVRRSNCKDKYTLSNTGWSGTGRLAEGC